MCVRHCSSEFLIKSSVYTILCMLLNIAGKLVGKSLYMGFYHNQTAWTKEDVDKVTVSQT